MNDKLAKPTIAPDSTSSDGHGPVGPGDGLHIESEVLEVRASKSLSN